MALHRVTFGTTNPDDDPDSEPGFFRECWIVKAPDRIAALRACCPRTGHLVHDPGTVADYWYTKRPKWAAWWQVEDAQREEWETMELYFPDHAIDLSTRKAA